MSTRAENLETISDSIDTMKTNLNLDSDASLSDVVEATAGGGGGIDIDDYFGREIRRGNNAPQANGWMVTIIKKLPSPVTPVLTNLDFTFASMSNLVEIPAIENMTTIISMASSFQNCNSIVTIPSLDTSNVKNMSSMCLNCTLLENVPVFNASSCTNFGSMFSNCTHLSDTSLDNILQMCISATSYAGTKTLATLGFTSTNYSSAKIQSLPHYSDFVAAGWSIGF